MIVHPLQCVLDVVPHLVQNYVITLSCLHQPHCRSNTVDGAAANQKRFGVWVVEVWSPPFLGPWAATVASHIHVNTFSRDVMVGCTLVTIILPLSQITMQHVVIGVQRRV